MDKRLEIYNEKMGKSYSNLLEEYDAIRAGRANPHLLDRIVIDYYGTPTPIQQVSNISVPEAKLIQIQPWEPNMLKEIERAIQMSDLGINPMSDGKLIRLAFPELTEERRIELTKEVKKKGEETKIAFRNIRRDANATMKKLGKEEDISEDEIKELDDEIQKITDDFVKKVDEVVITKSKELMTV